MAGEVQPPCALICIALHSALLLLFHVFLHYSPRGQTITRRPSCDSHFLPTSSSRRLMGCLEGFMAAKHWLSPCPVPQLHAMGVTRGELASSLMLCSPIWGAPCTHRWPPDAFLDLHPMASPSAAPAAQLPASLGPSLISQVTLAQGPACHQGNLRNRSGDVPIPITGHHNLCSVQSQLDLFKTPVQPLLQAPSGSPLTPQAKHISPCPTPGPLPPPPGRFQPPDSSCPLSPQALSCLKAFA